MPSSSARLAAGWIVTDGDRPLFGTDPDRPGIVTPLLPDRRTAMSLAAIVADGDEAWATRLGVAPLGHLCEAMRSYAAHGVVGLSPQGRWDGGAPPRVRFIVRRDEVGVALPTVVASGHETAGWDVIAHDGGTWPDGNDLVTWVRHDVTDRAAITFRDGMPLGQAGVGDHLFEVLVGGRPVIERDDPVAGPWGVACGVVQLVTDPGAAHDRCEALARASDGVGGPYEVAAIPDLGPRLSALTTEAPGAMVTVNPHGHREHAAIAYASRPLGVVPRWWDRLRGARGPMLRGPGGVWTIGQGNRFDLVAEAPEWSGCDTFFWDGTGSGVRPLGQVTVSWWEVRSGPLAVQSRAFNDLNAVVGFVADVVEAMVGANHPTASALRAKSLDARNDIEAIVRLVNLSSVGVFVERIWGGR